MVAAAGRQDVHFASHGEMLSGWLYPAKGGSDNNPGPAIVLSHGLGCTKVIT